MTLYELSALKNMATEPTLQMLLDNTELKEGLCYIDHLEIVFTQARNWGHQSYIKATGLKYRHGEVSEYLYEGENVDLGVLIRETKNCQYLTAGTFLFYDSQADLEIRTDIGNIQTCGKLYPELLASKDFSYKKLNTEWLKLKQIYKMKEDVLNMEDYYLVCFDRESGVIDTCLEAKGKALLKLWGLQNTASHQDSIIFNKATGEVTAYYTGDADFPKVEENAGNIEDYCPGFLAAIHEEEKKASLDEQLKGAKEAERPQVKKEVTKDDRNLRL